MNCSWLRTALVTMPLVLPVTAWAATSTGTGTGTGTTSGTGTGTGTTSGSGSDGSSGTTGPECSECIDSADPVQIVSPADGATVATTVDVRITVPYTCACDGCVCTERMPFSVNLRVDGSTTASCQNGDDGCNTEDQTFTIELTPGTHTLDAVADHDGHAEFSDPIEVTVPGGSDDTTGSPPPPPPPPASTSSGDSSSSSSAGAADGGGGGCGCHTEPASGGLLVGLFGLLGLGFARRRRG